MDASRPARRRSDRRHDPSFARSRATPPWSHRHDRHDVARAQHQKLLTINSLGQLLIGPSGKRILAAGQLSQLLERDAAFTKDDRPQGLIGEAHLRTHGLLVGLEDDVDVEIVRGEQIASGGVITYRPQPNINPDVSVVERTRDVAVVQTGELGIAQPKCDDVLASSHRLPSGLAQWLLSSL